MGRIRFAARPCCHLDLQDRNPNLACYTSSQNGDYFCEIVLKSTSNNEIMVWT